MIYQINSLLNGSKVFVCPDQATLDQGKISTPNGNFSIGGEAEANVLLNENQQAYLTTVLNLFSVNKDTDVLDGTIWEAVNLDTEPDNVDINYQIFDVINGSYTLATGLDNAKQLLATTKQNYLNCYIPLISFETWEQLPENNQTQPITTGTQEF
jgi:hypothetical protein